MTGIVPRFDTPGSGGREWTESAWTQVHGSHGPAHFATGFGFYQGIDVMQVGPFAYECVEPLKTIRSSLGKNADGGLSANGGIGRTSLAGRKEPA